MMLLALPNMMGAENTPAQGEVEVLHATEGGLNAARGHKSGKRGTEGRASTAPRVELKVFVFWENPLLEIINAQYYEIWHTPTCTVHIFIHFAPYGEVINLSMQIIHRSLNHTYFLTCLFPLHIKEEADAYRK